MNLHQPNERRTGFVLVLIFALLAAGIISVGYLYYRHSERHFRMEAERRLSAVATLKVSQLVQYRKERLGDALILFKNASISALVRRCFTNPKDADAQNQLQTWLGKYPAHFQYDRVFLLDAQGVMRMSAPIAPEPIAALISQRVSEVLRSGEVTFQDFYRDERNQRVYLAVLVPILDEQDVNRPLGVLVMRIDPAIYLYPFIQRWPTPSATAETLLIRKDGNDALFLNELKFQTNTALNLRISLENIRIPAVKAVRGQEGIVEGLDYRGKTVIADVRGIPDSPWFLVARIDVMEVYGPLRERLAQIVFLVGTLVFGAFLGVGLIWRQQRVLFYQERSKTEEELRESEERFRSIFDNTNDGILVVDMTTHKFQFGNRTICRMLGYTPEELMALGVSEIHSPKDLSAVTEAFGKMMRREIEMAPGLPVKRKDGSVFHADISSFPLQLGGRNCMIGFFRDVTERKQAEEALAFNNIILRTQQESSIDGILVVNEKGEILSFNQRFVDLWRIPLDVIESKSDERALQSVLQQLASPDEFIRKVKHLYEVRDETSRDEIDLKDGRSFDRYSAPMLGAGGKCYGRVWYFRDITERKQAEEALKRIEWMLTKQPALASETMALPDTARQAYGDLTPLNTSPVILDAVGREILGDIAEDFMRLLETSTSVYEKNGDYALGIFASGWCKFMDMASRRLCGTPDNREALSCGRWLCHESCWSEASRKSIETDLPVDIECAGGIHLYALPIRVGNEIIGSINFGYGNPPKDLARLQELAAKFDVSLEELLRHVEAYETRPPFIIELAKTRLLAAARLIGSMVGRKQAEEKITAQLQELRRWQAVMLGREDRSMEFKREVNGLLRRMGEPIRYPSQEEGERLIG